MELLQLVVEVEFSVNFSPVINIGAGGAGDGGSQAEQILQAFRSEMPALLRMLQQAVARQQRRSFGG